MAGGLAEEGRGERDERNKRDDGETDPAEPKFRLWPVISRLTCAALPRLTLLPPLLVTPAALGYDSREAVALRRAPSHPSILGHSGRHGACVRERACMRSAFQHHGEGRSIQGLKRVGGRTCLLATPCHRYCRHLCVKIRPLGNPADRRCVAALAVPPARMIGSLPAHAHTIQLTPLHPNPATLSL